MPKQRIAESKNKVENTAETQRAQSKLILKPLRLCG
jgi:hypothetical protein